MTTFQHTRAKALIIIINYSSSLLQLFLSPSWSIAHEAEGLMGYWLRDHSGSRNNCWLFPRRYIQGFLVIFHHMSRDTYSTIHLISKRRYLITLLIPSVFSFKKWQGLFHFVIKRKLWEWGCCSSLYPWLLLWLFCETHHRTPLLPTEKICLIHTIIIILRQLVLFVKFFFSFPFFKFVSLPPPRLGSPIRGWKLSWNGKLRLNE